MLKLLRREAQPVETDPRLVEAVKQLPDAVVLRQDASTVLVQTGRWVGLVRYAEGWVRMTGYSTEAFETIIYGNFSTGCGWMYQSRKHDARTFKSLKGGIK